MTSDETIRKAARVLALTDDYDGCFERIDAWEAATDEQRACGDVEEPLSSDAEDCEFWLRRARALAEDGLLAPAPLREECGIRWDDGNLWEHYLNRDEATVGAGDEGTLVRRWGSDWEEA